MNDSVWNDNAVYLEKTFVCSGHADNFYPKKIII